MSPEQARGDRDLDARVDIYGCGVMMYEMLTGRRPFRASNYNALLVQILSATPAPARELRGDLPVGFDRVIQKAMRRARNERYHTTTEFQKDLAQLRTYHPGAPAIPDLFRQAFGRPQPPRGINPPRAKQPSTSDIPTSRRIRGIVPLPGTPSSVEIPVEFMSEDGEPTVQTEIPPVTVSFDDVETKVASPKLEPKPIGAPMFVEEGEGANLTEVRYDALELLRQARSGGGSGARKTMPNYPDDEDQTDREKEVDPQEANDPNEAVTEVEESRRMLNRIKSIK
ncbi:MAG: hypothetical protein ABI551_04565, partial [Polyangiaceae bacterium]